MADVLVLGGTAWLGREIAAQAAAAGDVVTCLARGQSGRVTDGVTLTRADRSSPGAYRDVAGRPWDLVVDLARDPDQVRTALVALSATAAHWVFVSTISVYADHSHPSDEDDDLLPALAPGDACTPARYGEGKVACERAVDDARDALIVRAGLIAGPGDGSMRTTYWPRRFAEAADGVRAGPVLVPVADDLAVQMIDVRDLARFVLDAGGAGTTGPLDVTGPAIALADYLTAVRHAAGADLVDVHPAPVDALLGPGGLNPWFGPRSLPLVLPGDMAGMARRDVARAVAAGLVTRPAATTAVDILAESRVNPDPPISGLTAAEEQAAIAAVSPQR